MNALRPSIRREKLLAGGIFQILVEVVAIVLGFTADTFYPTFMCRPRAGREAYATVAWQDHFRCCGRQFHPLGILRSMASLTAPKSVTCSNLSGYATLGIPKVTETRVLRRGNRCLI